LNHLVRQNICSPGPVILYLNSIKDDKMGRNIKKQEKSIS
jgi:hypothetical protein